MLLEYKTVLNAVVTEFEEKRSRFITHVKPVVSEEEAAAFINEIKSKYWNATHNVYAYLLNRGIPVQRFSDDGEPSGTAGMPVLEVIRRMGIQDVVLVVTRYFGGTLLGASGLIRAYGRSASEGLAAAEIITRKLCVNIFIMLEYSLFGKLQNMLMLNGNIIKEVQYGQDVELTVLLEDGAQEGFIKAVVENTSGRAVIQCGDKEYITLDSGGKLLR